MKVAEDFYRDRNGVVRMVWADVWPCPLHLPWRWFAEIRFIDDEGQSNHHVDRDVEALTLRRCLFRAGDTVSDLAYELQQAAEAQPFPPAGGVS